MDNHEKSGNQQKSGFWNTFPGVLTALGGFIAAITSSIVALNQAGIIKSDGNKGTSSPTVSPTVVTTIPPTVSPSHGGDIITADNVARQIDNRTWEWQVFIQGSDETLAQVKCVEYNLHETFDPPQRTVCNQGSSSRAFALSASGYGTFLIRIRVIFKDGKNQELTHQLRFS